MTEPNLNGRVAASIRAEVARQRITQDQLADMLRLTRPSVSAILNGTSALTLGRVEQIAEALKIEPSKLLND